MADASVHPGETIADEFEFADIFHGGKIEKKRKKMQGYPAGSSPKVSIFSFSYAFFSFLSAFTCYSPDFLVYNPVV